MTAPHVSQPSRALRRSSAVLLAVVTTIAMMIFSEFGGTPAAAAGQPQVTMGKAAPYAVLAGTTVTNTGPTKISGDLGVAPGSAVTGFPPGLVRDGTIHKATKGAGQAKDALTTAYLDAKGRTPATPVGANIGGRTLAPGVYEASSFMRINGTVVLNAHSDPNAVFIFKAGSTLITASNATVRLTGGAQACHVFWQVGSSLTLGTNTTFVGTVLALTSASLRTGATVRGRILARNGAVTLDSNIITRPGSCDRVAASPSASSTASATPRATSTPTSSPVIPTGPPETGTAGTSHDSGGALMVVGALALFGAAVLGGQATRRRRRLTGQGPGQRTRRG
jgi:Ice-binding-like